MHRACFRWRNARSPYIPFNRTTTQLPFSFFFSRSKRMSARSYSYLTNKNIWLGHIYVTTWPFPQQPPSSEIKTRNLYFIFFPSCLRSGFSSVLPLPFAPSVLVVRFSSDVWAAVVRKEKFLADRPATHSCRRCFFHLVAYRGALLTSSELLKVVTGEQRPPLDKLDSEKRYVCETASFNPLGSRRNREQASNKVSRRR